MKLLAVCLAAMALVQPVEALQGFKDPITALFKAKEYKQHTHELACDACRIVGKKIVEKLEEHSPEEIVKMGRKGGTMQVDMKYARSELHLTDLFEGFCKHIPDYWAVAQEDIDGKWVYIDETNHIAHESEKFWNKHVREKKVMAKIHAMQKEMEQRNALRKQGIQVDSEAPFEADAMDVEAPPAEYTFHNKETLDQNHQRSVRYACRKVMEKTEDKLVEYLMYNWEKELDEKLPEVLCNTMFNLCGPKPEVLGEEASKKHTEL